MRLHYAGLTGFVFLVPWWLTFAAAAGAGEVMDYGSRIPSVDELEQGLKPNTGEKACELEKRRIKIVPPSETLETEGPAEALKTISLGPHVRISIPTVCLSGPFRSWTT